VTRLGSSIVVVMARLEELTFLLLVIILVARMLAMQMVLCDLSATRLTLTSGMQLEHVVWAKLALVQIDPLTYRLLESYRFI